MKKKIIVAMIAVGGLGLGWSANAQSIVGSDHDFSGEAWNGSGEICLPCHTPHNALSTLVPLWNHATSGATFTLYSSVTLDATVGQPSAASLACLSCHDGTVALDSFGGNTGTTFIGGGGHNLGTDLSNDHPVSFTYDAALATTDGGLHDPSTVNSGLGGTIDADLLLGSKMECASCHDVHNAAGLNGLLRIDNAASALCLTCHDK
jgi:predicted CXXCH cytochrome family protein